MDQTEIANLIYRCAELMDRGEWTEAAELFRHAKVRLPGGGRLVGYRKLLSSWLEDNGGEPSAPGTTRHLITNPVIEVDAEQKAATCSSSYTVLRSVPGEAMTVIATGHYVDQLSLVSGKWRFSRREWLDEVRLQEVAPEPEADVEAPADTAQSCENAEFEVVTQSVEPVDETIADDPETREKIVETAQQQFSLVAYSDVSMDDIANLAGVNDKTLAHHFPSRAELFATAYEDAMGGFTTPPDRSRFGEFLASVLVEQDDLRCPHAMTINANGNPEASEIAERIVETHVLQPMAVWLGGEHGDSRAREILALCAGCALYCRRVTQTNFPRSSSHMANWLAKAIQAVVDGT